MFFCLLFDLDCSNTLDWIGFRDILFPILTGRYTEGHLRNLFNLFDVNKTGYLSRQELAGKINFLLLKNKINV
jgi:Ca2+-binding EF-hand superfamily protein